MSASNTLLGNDALKELGLDLCAFADGMPGGFFVYEAEGEERILFANAQMANIFGCDDVEEFMELVGGSFFGVVYHEDRLRVEASIWSQINAKEQAQITHRDHVTYRIQSKDGSLHYMDEYGRLVRGTKHGDVFFVFVVNISRIESDHSAKVVRGLHDVVSPEIDELTLLPSMKYYHAHTAEVLAQAAIAGTPMVDVYFDVDHFKVINYRLGYEAGDEVLRRIAAVLRDCFPNDLLARFSDDHFVLVTQREGLEQRLDEVHARASRILSSTPVEIKAGIYALAPNDTFIDFDHDRAKVACSSIKGRYDKTYRFYDKGLSVDEALRDYVVSKIEEATQCGWLKNYYQPVVRVSSQLACGVEALSRWIDPSHGVLSPAQFIPYLEEARLINLVEKSVIERACADIKRSQRQIGVALPVSLNFSPSGLSLTDVPTLVDDTVKHYDVPRDLIRVEITESSLADDPELLRSTIKRLHNMGFSVWMDDFGSGYSSLNLLKDYDFDVLKVDMEFLRGMEGNKKSKTIVRSITELAKSMGMSTLVEGVETEEQLVFLQQVGADIAQGFLFSEPVPYEAIVSDFFLRFPPEVAGA